MGTSSSEINDLFLMRISDYRLDAIFAASGSLVLDTYLEAFLLDAIVDFEDICDQSLDYVVSGSASAGYFTETLSSENKSVLSQLMVKFWLAKSVSDVLQFSNALQDRDYRSFSQAQNLKEKRDYYSAKVEELSQLLVNYGYKKNNWTSWRNQDFY
jgi:hypothetical protein